MPAVLTDSALCDPCVPAAWREVLVDLQAFCALEAQLRGAGDKASDAAASLHEVHDRLLVGSRALLEPQALGDLPEAELRRLFARAVCCVTRMGESLAAESEVIDTAGSRTLPLYAADFAASAENVAAIRAALESRLGLTSEELRGIEDEVERDLEDARQAQAIVAALRAEFGLATGASDLNERAHRLFQALYPGVPLVADEVALIVTGTLVFFCLPYCDDEWTMPRFAALAECDRTALRSFLDENRRFAQERFAHFPAFGFLTPERIDPVLAERLAARCGLPAAVVARKLGRCVTILPRDEIEKYVVHDVWGHGWQAALLSFERMYEELADYADPLTLAETARHVAADGLRLGDCFRFAAGEVVLDEERFRRFVAAELCERLTVAVTAVFAETIADVAEFKLVSQHPDRPDLLPSSSLLRAQPAKLDLTMQDLPFYFGQATKVFRLFARSENRQRALVAELVAAGGTAASAAAAVRRTLEIWHALAEDEFAPKLAFRDAGDGRLRVNVFTRLALNFLGIHRAMVETYRQVERLARPTLPLRSCRDLMLLAAAVFFEADRPRNLWRVDEFVSLRFLPLCRELLAE